MQVNISTLKVQAIALITRFTFGRARKVVSSVPLPLPGLIVIY